MSESSNSAFDPNAVHYSDPEARMKLRMYLGSPQKFDEALEFGFPASHEADVPLTADRSVQFLAPLTLSHDLQSFMNGDCLSFLDSDEEIDDSSSTSSDDDADDHSLPDADSPVTPGESEDIFRNHNQARVRSTNASPDLSSPTPVKQQAPKTDLLSNALNGNREMTLRMTLTRPDLRANEEELYGWQGRPMSTDPLALEELPVSDDTTGANGPFAIKPQRHSSGSWKRLLSMVKKDRR